MKKIYFILIFSIISFLVFGEKKIMVIQSYNSKYEWDANYTQALKDTVAEGNSLYFFEMNTKTLLIDEQIKMAEQAYKKILEIEPDLVVLGDDAALKMLGPRIVPHEIPIVFLGINNNPRYYFNRYPSNITGILERPHLKRNLVLFKEFIPTAKRVLVLFDNDTTSQIVKKEYFDDKDSLTIEDMLIDIVLVDTLPHWKNLIKESKADYDFIILGSFQTIRDGEGNFIDMNQTIEWTSKNTPLPIFGFWNFSIGKNKAIGGYVISEKNMGIRAGQIINRIINGEKIDRIKPILENEGTYLFSRQQLEKWNLKIPKKISDTVEYTD